MEQELELPYHGDPTEGVEYFTKVIDYNEITSFGVDTHTYKVTEPEDLKAKELGCSIWHLPLGVKVYLRPNQKDIYINDIQTHYELRNFSHQNIAHA